MQMFFFKKVEYFLEFHLWQLTKKLVLFKSANFRIHFFLLGSSQDSREILAIKCAQGAFSICSACCHSLSVTHECELSKTRPHL